jgi:hypothetical protein
MKTYLPIVVLLISLCTTESRAQSNERTLSADSIIGIDGRLDSLFQTLPEVLVKGERPIVKSEQGKLVYDLPRLIVNKPIDNVYDAVKELPGVAEMNGSLTLSGQSFTLVLNGKVTNLNASQLEMVLKSIPASHIEKAEVMYNAPARYQVRGALINITLKQGDGSGKTDGVQGELYGKYQQKHYASFEERASLVFSKGKFSGDVLYSHQHGKSYDTTDKDALHTLADGAQLPVSTHEQRDSRFHTHVVRVDWDYNFGKEHALSFVYNGQYSSYHNNSNTSGTFTSNNRNDAGDRLHNGRLDYRTPFGLKAAVEFTFYNAPSSQHMTDDTEASDNLAFISDSRQRINAWKFTLSQEHALGEGWGLNYGGVFSTTVDNSYQYYTKVSDAQTALPDNMSSRRTEQILNLYAGFNKSFGKFSLDASLAAEHYRSPVWNRWDFYPVLNLSYTPAPGNIWQLAFSSDKNYPSYWDVQNSVSYLSGAYSEIWGNPQLKPSRKYQLSLAYILKGKYVFSGWYQRTSNYFVQTLYQSSERFAEIYKNLNFDYADQAGVQATLPFRLGSWLDSRLTLVGVWQHEKDADFWDVPFDRAIFWGMANLTNTFTLSTRPDLKLTLRGMIRSKAHQGIYDLPASGSVDVSLRYAFARGKAVLNLYANDLFETAGISPRIRFKTQNVDNRYSCYRTLGVSFTYKFGGYKERQHEAVDTSRFK